MGLRGMRATHLHRAIPLLGCSEVLILLPQPAARHQSAFPSNNLLSTYYVLGTVLGIGVPQQKEEKSQVSKLKEFEVNNKVYVTCYDNMCVGTHTCVCLCISGRVCKEPCGCLQGAMGG